MKKAFKFFPIALAALLSLSSLSACGSVEDESKNPETENQTVTEINLTPSQELQMKWVSGSLLGEKLAVDYYLKNKLDTAEPNETFEVQILVYDHFDINPAFDTKKYDHLTYEVWQDRHKQKISDLNNCKDVYEKDPSEENRDQYLNALENLAVSEERLHEIREQQTADKIQRLCELLKEWGVEIVTEHTSTDSTIARLTTDDIIQLASSDFVFVSIYTIDLVRMNTYIYPVE